MRHCEMSPTEDYISVDAGTGESLWSCDNDRGQSGGGTKTEHKYCNKKHNNAVDDTFILHFDSVKSVVGYSAVRCRVSI